MRSLSKFSQAITQFFLIQRTKLSFRIKKLTTFEIEKKIKNHILEQ